MTEITNLEERPTATAENAPQTGEFINPLVNSFKRTFKDNLSFSNELNNNDAYREKGNQLSLQDKPNSKYYKAWGGAPDTVRMALIDKINSGTIRYENGEVIGMPFGYGQSYKDAVVGYFKSNEREPQQEFREALRSKTLKEIQELDKKLEQDTGIVSTVAKFAGAMGATMTEPANIATLPFGGFGAGKTILQVARTEALLGATSEAVIQPFIKNVKQDLRQDYGASDALLNIAMAGAGSAILGGTIQGGVNLYGKYVSKSNPELHDKFNYTQDVHRATEDITKGTVNRNDLIDGIEVANIKVETGEHPRVDIPTPTKEYAINYETAKKDVLNLKEEKNDLAITLTPEDKTRILAGENTPELRAKLDHDVREYQEWYTKNEPDYRTELYNQLKETRNPSEADMNIALIDARAKALGMDTQKYLRDNNRLTAKDLTQMTDNLYNENLRAFGAIKENPNIIRVFEDSDLTTVPRQLWTHFERNMTQQEKDGISKAFGKSYDDFTTADREAFAELGVKYLSEGIAPTQELKSVFETFREWLRDLWEIFTTTKEGNAKLTPEQRDFYAMLLGDEKAAQRIYGVQSKDPYNAYELPTVKDIERDFTKSETELQAEIKNAPEDLQDEFLKMDEEVSVLEEIARRNEC
jgi:hypothetical protein